MATTLQGNGTINEHEAEQVERAKASVAIDPAPIRLRVQEQPILSAASVVEAEPEWEASGGARHSRS